MFVKHCISKCLLPRSSNSAGKDHRTPICCRGRCGPRSRYSSALTPRAWQYPRWSTGNWRGTTDDTPGCQTGGKTKMPRKCVSEHRLFCPRACYGQRSGARAVSDPRAVCRGPHHDTLPSGQKNEAGWVEGMSPSALQRRVPAEHGTGLCWAKRTSLSIWLDAEDMQENENLYLCLLVSP